MDSQSIYAWDSRGCIQSVLLHAGTEDTIRETVTTALSHVLKGQSFVFLVPMNSKVLREWETRDGAPSGSNNTGASSFSWSSIAQNRTQARSDPVVWVTTLPQVHVLTWEDIYRFPVVHR